MNAMTQKLLTQHVIDPEICIRCNTCEESCPLGAVIHNDDNYVVQADICNRCMKCIDPCPTGAINNWRYVTTAYSTADQFSWTELPLQEKFPETDPIEAPVEALQSGGSAPILEAPNQTSIKPIAPPSASRPVVNLHKRTKPVKAKVISNVRLTAADLENDIHHIVVDFGETPFPILEGQSVGIVLPGTDREGRRHAVRQYSIASPRNGEREGQNALALTVKRMPDGVCSNYLCDLGEGDWVDVTGPFGVTFLLPEDPAANIIMICTGTGVAPFRGFIKRRIRAMPASVGQLVLLFGAQRPEALPYFDSLQRLPPQLVTQHLCYSRLPDKPREYVQDRILAEGARLTGLMRGPTTHIYVCGLKGMETGVNDALGEACRRAGIEWPALRDEMRGSGRYHVETY